MSEQSNEPFTVATRLTLDGPGLETITEENYQEFREVLARLDISVTHTRSSREVPLYVDNFVETAVEIELKRRAGIQTWNALTHNGTYAEAVMKARNGMLDHRIDLRDIALIPEWQRKLYLDEHIMSWRGLQRAVTSNRIETLTFGKANPELVRAVVSKYKPTKAA